MSKLIATKLLFVLGALLLFFPMISYSQDLICRNWFYVTDSNGNKIKDKCNEAWQVNADGQKHGKYIEYYENGNPAISATYSNGRLNGAYTEYADDGITVINKGGFINDKKEGLWKEGGNSGTYRSGEAVGVWKFSTNTGVGYLNVDFDKNPRFSYHWNSLVLQCDNGSGATGEIALQFEFKEVVWANKIERVVKIAANGDQLHSFDNGEWIARENIISKEFYCDFTLEKDLLNSVIEAFPTRDGKPQDGFVVLTFTNGKVSKNEYRFFDSSGKPRPDYMATVQTKRKEREAIAGSNVLLSSDLLRIPVPPSIKCKAKSYEIEDEAALESLKAYLQNINTAGIKNFILVGHADAYKDLGIYSFNSQSHEPVYFKDGRQTRESEQELATIRFYLSVGRLKTVYNAIADLEAIKKLIVDRKFLMLPAGTVFGEELKTSNPDIVQIVIIAEDSRGINSEPVLLSLNDDPHINRVTLDGAFFKRVNQYANDVSYLIGGKSFFIYNYLGKETFGKQIPPYHLFQTNFQTYRDCNNWREDTWDK